MANGFGDTPLMATYLIKGKLVFGNALIIIVELVLK
jgi:hypothetical protein